VQRIELEHKYLQAIETLSPKCRTVFEMSRLEGKRNQEIADELKLSKRTVETHISQALKILRKKLGDYLSVILF
jgi:RNA polymerase sigma-70 factor (ECF subfamily)